VNRVLVVATTSEGARPTGITYGEQALTQAAYHDESVQQSAVWYLLNPPTGTTTITITGGSNYTAFAVYLSGANQDAPDATNGATDTVDPVTLPITTATADCLGLAVFGNGNTGTWTGSGGTTIEATLDGSSMCGGLGTKSLAAIGAHTLDADVSSSNRRSSGVVVAFAPAPSGTKLSKIIQAHKQTGGISL